MAKNKSSDELEIMRHSLSHIMAAAVKELWPQVKLAIGPAIDSGWYYDFDFNEDTKETKQDGKNERSSISESDLTMIEKKMAEIIKRDIKFKRYELKIDQAIKREKQLKQIYKVDLLEELKAKGEKKVSYYRLDDFTDLCRGPHLESSGLIKDGAYKLDKLAGAYWQGNEKNKMLTRIYGLAFGDKQELSDYLKMMAEAAKRDHRQLGKELDLFVFSALIGQGLPVYTPKGAIIRQAIVDYSNELQQSIGYQQVHSPQLNKAELFKTSGHYEKFKDDMLSVKSHYSDEEFFLKPMNCPQHTQLYASRGRSYRDLPVRYADFANLFRDEKPGELNGLYRLRCFSQDDGHCFCRQNQIEQEFTNVLGVIKQALTTYGLDYHVRLSLWDENKKQAYLGDKKIWQKSQQLLEALLKKNKIKYSIAEGEAAFYGPKMDIIARDALGRQWQISTIQLDFNMPERFNLVYIDKNGQQRRPVMIHRAIIGSPERFMGILIEHYGGAFPLWLAPVQVKIISVGSDHKMFCHGLAAEFKGHGIRVEVDEANETVGNKIRKAVKEKIPYLLVIGDKEMKSAKLAVRDRGGVQVRQIEKRKFIEEIKERAKSKTE